MAHLSYCMISVAMQSTRQRLPSAGTCVLWSDKWLMIVIVDVNSDLPLHDQYHQYDKTNEFRPSWKYNGWLIVPRTQLDVYRWCRNRTASMYAIFMTPFVHPKLWIFYNWSIHPSKKPTNYIFLCSNRSAAMTPIDYHQHPYHSSQYSRYRSDDCQTENFPVNASKCHLPAFIMQVSQGEKDIWIHDTSNHIHVSNFDHSTSKLPKSIYTGFKNKVLGMFNTHSRSTFSKNIK